MANIDNNKRYRVIDGTETIEVCSYSGRKTKKGTIVRTGKDTYRVISSNEEKHFKSETTEKERNTAMTRKLAKLRNVIRANIQSGVDMVATVTYAKPIDNYKMMQNDVEKCMHRLREKHNIEYIAVPELQPCGKWHVHIIILLGDGADTITRDDLNKAWRRGGVHISTVRSTNAIALYLSTNSGPKGMARRNYPPGMRLYHCSQGVVRPKSVIMDGEDINKLVGDCKMVYRRCYQIGGVYWGSKTVYDKTKTED